ncbi:MAG: hypothetical protein IPP65_12100 [Chlorobi bacterium]|nr:hypothetical protein [Chlorobiota bacterium]
MSSSKNKIGKIKLKKYVILMLSFCFLSTLTFGCKEDNSDLQKQWSDMKNSVSSKLSDLKIKSDEINTKVKNLPGFNPSDTSSFGKQRNELDKLLYTSQSIFSEANSMISRSSITVEEAINKGKRSELETALNQAKQEFDAVNMKLANVETMLPSLNELVNTISVSTPKTNDTIINKQPNQIKKKIKILK